MSNLNNDQLKLLINLFTTDLGRNNFIKNSGIVGETLKKFENEFSLEICSNHRSWSEEKFLEFENFIIEISIKKFLWPIILRSITCGMAEGDERVNVTGSHLL